MILKTQKRFHSIAMITFVPIIALVVWWFASANSTSTFFPPLSGILIRFREMWLFDLFLEDIVPSLTRMISGFLIALFIGVILGVMLGRLRYVRYALGPFVHFGRAIPATALLPVAMTLLGVGDGMKIALIALVCMFPILLNTMDAVAATARGLQDVAASYRLTPFQRLSSILLPSAAPQICAGARVALGIAFIMMIVTEMLAATNGIGYVTVEAQQAFKIKDMWAGMILLGLLGIALNGLFVLIERSIIRWKPLTLES